MRIFLTVENKINGVYMNRTIYFKTGMIILTMAVVIAVSGCSLTGGNAATTPPATAAVTRGDLTTYISASGNLSYPDTQDIRLQTTGTVSEVLVQAGDMVKQGDVLVRLDDSSLQDKIRTDQLAINSTKISLEKVTNTYKQKIYPYTFTTFAVDIPESVASINEAVRKVTDAKDKLSGANGAEQSAAAANELRSALLDLDAATIKLTFGQGDTIFQRAVTGAISLTGTKFWDLRSAQLDVDTAQANLDNAMNNLADDKSDLDKTVVKAPFDGLVTNVSATDGAVMNTNNVAVTMTNPNKLEADVLVNEIDIFNVKINGTATVAIDSVQGLIVPATVTYIQPTATIQSGVVNYIVKVELNQNITGASVPAANSTRPAGTAAANGTASFTNLRQGLSVTVNIVKTTDKNVLLVPNRVVIRTGTTTTAQVINSTGAIEVRTITTGASDNRNTEVTRGLAEGEKVIVQSAAARTATPAAGGFAIGGGRPPFAPGAAVEGR
jgi:HlyD family secretion protein